jgi:hypothetical protein
VTVVWAVDPGFKTVTVHRNCRAPEMFNIERHLSGDPFLTGLTIPVATLFDDE